MVLIPWRCYADFSTFSNEMNQLFDRFFAREVSERPWAQEWYPEVSIIETAEAVVIHMKINDFPRENLDISFHDRVLVVKGSLEHCEEMQSRNLHYTRCNAGSFLRSIQIDQEINPEAIDATLRNGILCIVLPKIKKELTIYRIGIT